MSDFLDVSSNNHKSHQLGANPECLVEALAVESQTRLLHCGTSFSWQACAGIDMLQELEIEEAAEIVRNPSACQRNWGFFLLKYNMGIED
mgnify:CR=1 FL=1